VSAIGFQTEGLRLPVYIAPEHTGFRPDRHSNRIGTDTLHRRRVDHQTALADRVSGDVVAAALYRKDQVVLADKAHRRDDVVGASGLFDQCRTAVDQAIKELARLVILAEPRLCRPVSSFPRSRFENPLRATIMAQYSHPWSFERNDPNPRSR
jgi:hypothetical protein